MPRLSLILKNKARHSADTRVCTRCMIPLILPDFSHMYTTEHRYFKIHKPRNMVSQFVSSHAVNLLTGIDFNFPEGTHAIGRLDNDSEGLLLLTTNKKITRLLFSSGIPHERTYLVQVNNILTDESLFKLRNGVDIRIKGGQTYTTPRCHVSEANGLGEMYEDVTCGTIGPHTWLTITLTEGKYHQVRKMIGAVRHRCKRLIRLSIESMELGTLPPGEVMEIPEESFFQQLRLFAPVVE